MQISFVVIILSLVFLMVYKAVHPFGMHKLVLGTLLFLLLCGFFIAPVQMGETFSLNVLFSFCVVFLGLSLAITLGKKTKLWLFLAIVLTLATYYAMVQINSDLFTFFTYLPMVGVVTVFGLVFVKKQKAMVAFALLAYFAIEWFNYFFFFGNIGYLSICSYEFLNSVAITVLLLYVVHFLLKVVFYQKQNKEVRYEKK